MLKNNLGAFKSNFRFRTATDDLPSTGERLFFPGASRIGGRNGISVHLATKTKAWMGTFQAGESSLLGLTGAFATPNPNALLVVSTGRGYLVDVLVPERTELLSFFPITHVVPNPAAGLLALGNLTDLMAIGESGIRWKTDRLAWDGFEICAVDQNVIQGRYEDLSSDEITEFVVDWRSGKVTTARQ